MRMLNNRRLKEAQNELEKNPNLEGLWFSLWGGWSHDENAQFKEFVPRSQFVSGAPDTDNEADKTIQKTSKKR